MSIEAKTRIDNLKGNSQLIKAFNDIKHKLVDQYDDNSRFDSETLEEFRYLCKVYKKWMTATLACVYGDPIARGTFEAIRKDIDRSLAIYTNDY